MGTEVVPIRRSAVGKPSKYNAERHKKIVRAIRKGNSLTTAGKLAGLGMDTIHEWMAKGRREAEKYPELAKLVADVQLAAAEREAEHIKKIEEVALSDKPNTWQAAAWMLERKNPADWGRKDKVQVQTSQPAVTINQVVLGDAGAREDARQLLRRATAIDVSAHEPIGPGVHSEPEEE